MAELARVGVMQAMSLTHTWDDTLAQKVRDEESKVDQYEDALGTYLVKLSSRELNHADSQSVNTLLHTISDFERISDLSLIHICEPSGIRTGDAHQGDQLLHRRPRRAAGA